MVRLLYLNSPNKLLILLNQVMHDYAMTWEHFPCTWPFVRGIQQWIPLTRGQRHKRPNTSQWRHNGRDSVSNHQPHDCLLNCLSDERKHQRSVTGLCVGNSPLTGEFPAQMASNAKNVSIWWRHHDTVELLVRWYVMTFMSCPFSASVDAHVKSLIKTFLSSRNWRLDENKMNAHHILIWCLLNKQYIMTDINLNHINSQPGKRGSIIHKALCT